jgi:Spy/CpxP family protein refolding chaperone
MRLMTAVVLLAVFAAGFAAGAAFIRMRPPPFPPPGPPSLRGIDLTGTQRTDIDAIAHKYRPQMDAILRESFPRVRTLEEAMNKEIRALLTPDQQKRFDDNEAHRPPFPPPGGPGPHGPPGFPPDGPPPGAP